VVHAAREYHSSNPGQDTPSVARFAESAVARSKTAETFKASASDGMRTTSAPADNHTTRHDAAAQPIPFEKEYHSSVARAMADVADAVGYAHAGGILHRDIKPHNIMIEPNGHVWVIDFGLAGFLQPKPDSDDSNADGESEPKTVQSFDGNPQLTQGIGGGTSSYMAPERWDGRKANELSDVWALGATLYELLTLRRAFDGPSWEVIRRRIQAHTVKPPKELVKGLPADLAAICRKAMHHEPSHRYQTTAELAADLRRWLNHEPTTALPARVPRRTFLWCRRNPGWAALISAMVVMVSLLVGVNAGAAAKEQARQRQLGIRAIERIQSTTHLTEWKQEKLEGWSEEIWNYGTSLPALEGEADLRDALANSLIDLDAEDVYSDLTTRTTHLAFNASGELLVTGGDPGIPESPDHAEPKSPRVFDVARQVWKESTINGYGPVAFRPDGVPVVIVPAVDNVRRIQLLDVNTGTEISAMTIAGTAEQLTDTNRPLLAMTADAKFVVAALKFNADANASSDKETYEVTVWKTETSTQIHRCLVDGASSLSLSLDGTILAVGRKDGWISIWQVGGEAPAVELPHGRFPVGALALARDYRRSLEVDPDSQPGTGWLLAAGDDASGLVVWDLSLGMPRTVLRGQWYETLSLAFSTDSSLLYSVGRAPGRIWDVATGEQVLNWMQSNYMPGLAVGPNGLFASSGSPIFAPTASIRIQKLRFDRGGAVLRGLVDVPRRLVTSQDGSLVAALTMTCFVGVWKTDGTLLHVFEAPVGPFADNATISFKPDNKELFCCTGDKALTWNLRSGEVSRTWQVDPALNNESAWSPDGKHLYFARKEVEDGSRYPMSDAPSSKYPRVVRAYDLLSSDDEKPVLELKGIAQRAYRIRVGANGLLVLCGEKTVNPMTSLTECWDLATRKQLWSLPCDIAQMSPDGSRLVLKENSIVGGFEILDTRSLTLLKPAQPIETCDDDAQYAVAGYKRMPDREDGSVVVEDHRYLVVYPAGKPTPLVSLFFEASIVWDSRLFRHGENTHVAWTNDNGHVVVVNLDKVRSRLETIGLGW